MHGELRVQRETKERWRVPRRFLTMFSSPKHFAYSTLPAFEVSLTNSGLGSERSGRAFEELSRGFVRMLTHRKIFTKRTRKLYLKTEVKLKPENTKNTNTKNILNIKKFKCHRMLIKNS